MQLFAVMDNPPCWHQARICILAGSQERAEDFNTSTAFLFLYCCLSSTVIIMRDYGRTQFEGYFPQKSVVFKCSFYSDVEITKTIYIYIFIII